MLCAVWRRPRALQLAVVPGLVDLQIEKQVLIPQLRIQVDYGRAALYGLTPAAITQALDALANGRRVSQIVDGNRRFDVVMRLSDQDRSTTGLRDLLIATPTGHVPLGLFADVAETDGPNQIQREGTQRRIIVYGNGDGRRDMAAIAADIRRVLAGIKLPQGYRTSLEGAFQAQEEAAWRIGALSLLSLARDLRRSLQPLSFGGARTHHHGRHSARAHRQRRSRCIWPASRSRSPR